MVYRYRTVQDRKRGGLISGHFPDRFVSRDHQGPYLNAPIATVERCMEQDYNRSFFGWVVVVVMLGVVLPVALYLIGVL